MHIPVVKQNGPEAPRPLSSSSRHTYPPRSPTREKAGSPAGESMFKAEVAARSVFERPLPEPATPPHKLGVLAVSSLIEPSPVKPIAFTKPLSESSCIAEGAVSLIREDLIYIGGLRYEVLAGSDTYKPFFENKTEILAHMRSNKQGLQIVSIGVENKESSGRPLYLASYRMTVKNLESGQDDTTNYAFVVVKDPGY